MQQLLAFPGKRNAKYELNKLFSVLAFPMMLLRPSLGLCSVVENMPYKTEQNRTGLAVWWKQGYLK